MNKFAIKNGLIYGGVASLIYLIIYFVKPELNFNAGIGTLISIIVPIMFMRSGILQSREENEGQITFGEGLITGLVVFFIGSLIFNVTSGALIQLDKGYKEVGEQVTLETSVKAFEATAGMFNLSEEDMEKAREELTKNPPKITMSIIFIGFLGSLIFPGLIIALIMAAILKRT